MITNKLIVFSHILNAYVFIDWGVNNYKGTSQRPSIRRPFFISQKRKSYFSRVNPAELYILEKPEPFRSMLLEIQVYIEQTLPDYDLLYKWRLPIYYSDNCPICYLNVTKGYLDVCFWARTGFNVHLDVLVSEKRKFVKSLRYFKPEDIDGKILIECLEEANRTKIKGFTAG